MQELLPSDNSLTLNEATLPILKQISEGIPGGFFIYHADGAEELIYANRAMLHLFGCATEEEFRAHVGNSFRGMVHPDDLETVEKSIAEQIASSRFHLDYVEYRIIQKNGAVRWVEDYGHFMHTKEYGNIFYVFVGDATDRLTERVAKLERINQALQRVYAQQEQYRRALLHDAVMAFEIDVTQDTFLTPGAQAVERQLAGMFDSGKVPHFTRYSQLAEYWVAHAKPGERERYRDFFRLDRLRACYEQGDLEQTLDIWSVDAFGAERLIRYTFLLGRVEDTGNIFALAILKDITNTVGHQKVLEAAWKQAESANVARNAFLNHLSHEIKTPLNGLLGYADLMSQHLDDRQKLEEDIARIRLLGGQLYTLWKESLEMSDIESGKSILEETPCDLLNLLEEIVQRGGRKAEAKGLIFSFDDSGVIHSNVIADRVRVREVLWQILDNAIQYTPTGGTVSFQARELPRTSGKCGRYCIEIADNGIGIAETFLPKMFEPFAREHSSTESGVFGSGLGLAVAKNLAELMDGSIEVVSAPGKGSMFTVTLPLRLQKLEEKDEGAEEELSEEDLEKIETELKGTRLLLAEDNAINQEMAVELLASLGFEVDTADDGAEALQKVKDGGAGRYDAVLMDLQMPVMDGYAATRAIRALEDADLAQLPVIAFSADALSAHQKKAIEAGMNACCPKPLDLRKLCFTLFRLLRSRSAQ